MLRILGHDGRLLGLQNLVVTFQLLVALLESGIGERTTAEVTSDLLLLLIAAELDLNPLLLASLLVQLGDSRLLLDVLVVLLLLESLDLSVFFRRFHLLLLELFSCLGKPGLSCPNLGVELLDLIGVLSALKHLLAALSFALFVDA